MTSLIYDNMTKNRTRWDSLLAMMRGRMAAGSDWTFIYFTKWGYPGGLWKDTVNSMDKKFIAQEIKYLHCHITYRHCYKRCERIYKFTNSSPRP